MLSCRHPSQNLGSPLDTLMLADKSMTPYYKRMLDSFADGIITKVVHGDHLWYATLDTGPYYKGFGPDFSSSGKTPEEAVANCAAKIRADAQGTGKFAPHDILTPGYDLHFRLMKWWAEKETNGRQQETA